ncbi:MAG: alpha/beta hydrolase [Pseudomonadota bacterium]
MSLSDIRSSFDAFLAYPCDAPVERLTIDGMSAVWVGRPAASHRGAILFCHGGGFQIGSIASHMGLMARLSEASGRAVLGFEYRLAPEHRFPGAPDDALRVYRWLLDQGESAQNVALIGDSAGAALALGVAVRAPTFDLPRPGCLALISPWLDLTMSGESYTSRVDADLFSKPDQLRAMARTYLGRDHAPEHWLASPLFAEFAGLPPTLVHAGDCDITLSDAIRFHKLASQSGVAVDLRVWPEMYHHFQVFEELPEAQESVALIGSFVRAHLK